MPSTSPAELYLSSIAPDYKLPPCAKGFYHTVRVCMGMKNPHNIGRCYAWCHGGNHECNVRSPVLSVDEQDMLHKKLKEFKAKLKADKKQISTLSSATSTCTARKRSAQSLLKDSSDEEPDRNDMPPSKDTVKVHMYFGDNAIESHDGAVVDGTYSFKEDQQFREWSSWPAVRWLMFDVVQKRWVDILTLAKIEVGSGPLLTRQNDPDADLSAYEGLLSLIEEALDAYALTSGVAARQDYALPSSSQTIPNTSSPVAQSLSRATQSLSRVAESAKSRKRARRC